MEIRWLGRMDYLPALALQREVHAAVADGTADETLLLVEHEGVFTAGKRTAPSDLPPPGTPVIDVDRGGRITWHGPGQLTGYPIVRLPSFDVVAHVRRLETMLMGICREFGVETTQVEGRSGVWVQRPGRPDAKIAAIGVRVARDVTMHGFALNCDCDLSAYAAIVPCGIADATVTSLTGVAGRPIPVEAVLPLVIERAAHLQGTLVP